MPEVSCEYCGNSTLHASDCPYVTGQKPLEPGQAVRLALGGRPEPIKSLLRTETGQEINYRRLVVEHNAGDWPTILVEGYLGEGEEIEAILCQRRPTRAERAGGDYER